MTLPILATKLHLPTPRPQFLQRSRLIDQLNAGWQHRKLTLVSAAAGFGKTTLITTWIQQNRQEKEFHVAWLSLDEDDGELHRFLTYFIAALKTAEPTLGDGVLTMLQSPQLPPPESLLTVLLNEIAAISSKIVLVLDDFHLLDSPVIDQAIAFFLEHQPRQIHLVMTTREDPSLPLARLRVRGELTEIRAADLRFTPEETAVFLNEIMGLSLTAGQVKALETRTEGWIASLQLAALSLNQQDSAAKTQFIEQFSGSNRYVMDYLVDEILTHLTPEARQFLIETAVFDRFCAELCDAVRQTTDARQTIDTLLQANLLIIPLDDQQQWLRYHHLFADFLHNRFLQQPDQQRIALRQRAIDWFASQNLLDEAIAHALAVEDFSKASDLMASYSANLLVRGEVSKLLHWINLLPAAEVKANTRLAIFYSWALLFTGQFTAVSQWIAELEDVAGTPDWPLPTYVAVIKGYFATRNGRFTEGIAITEEALIQLEQIKDKDEIQAIMVGAAEINLADSYMLSDQFDKAYEQYQTAVTVNRETGNILAGLGAVKALADLTIAKGQLHKARDILQQGMQMAQYWQGQLPIPGTKLLAAAPLQATLGLLHCQWNDLATAKPLIEEAAELYQLGGAVNEAEGISALMHLRWAEGNLLAVDHLLEQFRLLAQSHPHEYTQQRIICAMVEWKIRLIKADSQWHYYHRDIEAWVNNQTLADEESLYVNEFFFYTYALALLYLGQSEQLLPLLHRLKRAAEGSDRLGDLARLQMLQLLLFAQNKNTAVSLETLATLLKQTEPEGYIRLFVDEGEIVAKLLHQLPVTSYRNQLLSHFPIAQTTAQVLVEPLSDRELEVLALIADGATNQQIADQLVIAKSTAKKHVSNIIGKLGVENRTAAIAQARELGLII